MEKLFSVFDEMKRNYETELLSSNHNKMKDLQLRALEQYSLLPVPNRREKIWNQLFKQVINESSLQLASEPKIVNNHEKSKKGKVSGTVQISEDTVEFWLEENLLSNGVVLCDLYSAAEQHSDLLNDVLKKNETGFNKISAITAGLGRHGFLLYIPKQLKVEKPIEITALVKKAKIFLPACGFIILGEQASASIILRYTSELSDKDSAVLSLNVLASVGEAADLQFLEIQKLGKKVWNFVTEKSILGKQANLERFMLDSGGTVNKRSFSVDLREEGGQATVTGVYKPQADQVYIYDTEQNHLASKTSSNLFFSGVLKNDAYSLWKGNVYVAEGTRGADGFQINKNLLLDEAAHAESIPGLEILADDVRCSHAVTLSSVDAEQMFFLESRGIGPVEAEELIVNGFLEAASNRMKDKALKEIILDALK